ncbi:MAG: fumarylacetoacetate hydrolase family protein [Gammaproteobacteria bacterium]|nr:fumarylacetoacetate hydrolase family protein [Gammaproteobacteria bacterium]
MRVGTCLYQTTPFLFVECGQEVHIPALDPRFEGPEHRDVLAFIEAGPGRWREFAQALSGLADQSRVDRGRVTIVAPIPRPRKNIMCLGWNYAEHAAESAAAAQREVKLPEYPIIFTKSVTSVTGPEAAVPHDPEVTTELDWEVELGVIIGTGGKRITAEDALDHVFGYTVINDLSARDLQFRHKQFFLGKSLDAACPMGPCIVTADELADPQDLDLKCWVNGELKQDSNTRHQIFDIRRVIATLSLGMTLEPGDIIATGTPSGVGFARTPPEFLSAGDVVECEVAGIGRLRNPIV